MVYVTTNDHWGGKHFPDLFQDALELVEESEPHLATLHLLQVPSAWDYPLVMSK